MTESDNRTAPRQLTLFAVESVATAPPLPLPPSCEKTYRSWRGEFQIISQQQRGKKIEYEIAIDVYDPAGKWQLVEITTQSLDVALQEFYDTVDHTFNNTVSGVIPLAPEQPSDLGHSFNQSCDETETAPEHSTTVLEQVTSDTPYSSNPDSNVLEQESTNTIKVVPEHNHWVEKYPVKRYANQYYYFRYVWMEGRKLHHVHIGGNVRSPLAQSRKELVENAIADGVTPVEIEKIIRSWRNNV